ncbi:MAG: pyruvate synthase [Actinobacteria bacterium]|nr:pyruvate synthase [Actinomycetota bacterium]
MSSSLTEIRWHGRGGQGAVTAAKMVAEIAAEHGKCFQAFPEYGPERSGAPIVAFTRLSDDPIQCYSAVEHPAIVLVLDETLLSVVDVTDGAPADAAVIVNTEKSPSEIKKVFDFGKRRVYTIPATKIAKQTLGRAIPNTPMVSALSKITGQFSLGEIEDHLRHTFGKKFPPKVVEANVEAAHMGFEEVQE